MSAVRALPAGQQPAEAPEGAAAQAAAAHPLVAAVSVDFYDAHAAADVDQQVGKQVGVGCG